MLAVVAANCPALFSTVPNTGREFLTNDKARWTSSAVVFPSSTTRSSASVYGEKASTSAVWSSGGSDLPPIPWTPG